MTSQKEWCQSKNDITKIMVSEQNDIKNGVREKLLFK